MAVEMTSDAYFCCRCGTELHTRALDCFDVRTGLRKAERFCPNTAGKCRIACDDRPDGHRLNFWGNCKDCGEPGYNYF